MVMSRGVRSETCLLQGDSLPSSYKRKVTPTPDNMMTRKNVFQQPTKLMPPQAGTSPDSYVVLLRGNCSRVYNLLPAVNWQVVKGKKLSKKREEMFYGVENIHLIKG